MRDCAPVNSLQQQGGGVGYVRLQGSVGAVDQVPVVDLLQDQQGARLVTLEGETPKIKTKADKMSVLITR